MSRDKTLRTPRDGGNAVEDPWGFDESIIEVNALLSRLARHWSTRASEDEDAWAEFFGPLLGAEQVQQILRVDSAREIDEFVRRKKLLALPTREGEPAYPAFQFTKDGNVYPEIERIVGIFDGVVATPYTIASWLRGPKEYLEGYAPIRWLELKRDPEPVFAGAEVAAARLAR